MKPISCPKRTEADHWTLSSTPLLKMVSGKKASWKRLSPFKEFFLPFFLIGVTYIWYPFFPTETGTILSLIGVLVAVHGEGAVQNRSFEFKAIVIMVLFASLPLIGLINFSNPWPTEQKLPTLIVYATPNGGDVVIDGVSRGKSPNTFSLTPGDHQISLRVPGKAWYETQVRIPNIHMLVHDFSPSPDALSTDDTVGP